MSTPAWPIPYLHLPELKTVKLLWHSDYYDGPLSGMCEYEGQKCWFELCADGDNYDEEYMLESLEDYGKLLTSDGFYRRYLVYPLPPDDLAEEEYWHNLFREHVGTNCDYDDDGSRAYGTVKTQVDWPKYYEPAKQRAPRDHKKHTPIGWFEG